MRNLCRFMPAVKHALTTMFAVLMFVTAASAYTIVLRDGRRREIPAQFTVTNSALTYEVSPGFQVSMLLASIDVAATERANGEVAGSLLRRTGQVISLQPVANGTARRSITNQDLATYARVREASEDAFDRRQMELGQPSLQELHERRTLDDQRLFQEMKDRRERVEAENRRAETEALRDELTSLDAQLSFLRSRIDASPSSGLSDVSFDSGLLPFGGDSPFWNGFGDFDRFGNRFGIRFGNFNRFGRFDGFGGSRGFPFFGRRRVYASPRGVVPLASRGGFIGGPVRGRVFNNPRGHFGRRR